MPSCRVVTGLPTTTKVPHPSQKWVKGKKVGGGAYIPCDWKLHLGESACLEETLALIQGRLRNIDEEGEMGVEVCQSYVEHLCHLTSTCFLINKIKLKIRKVNFIFKGTLNNFKGSPVIRVHKYIFEQFIDF